VKIPRPPFRRRAAFLAALFLALATAAAPPAAPQESEAPAPIPTGVAGLVLPGRPTTTVPFALAPDGPRFALAPIAAALGVELEVGPKGESHTLVFDDKEVRVGPDRALMVTVAAAGRGREEITSLSGQPIRGAAGLLVPLDFLTRTFGNELNLELAWNAQELKLEVSRREVRTLTGSINVVHQHGISTVEILFSERPRYRVGRLPGALEIRFLGDRLELPRQRPMPGDPLVAGILTRPDRVRIELAEDAAAGEPRLLTAPVAGLIIEVFERTAAPAEVGGDRPPALSEPSRGGIRTIVLDPGHGGEESGAIGASGTAEAELTLRVGRLLKRQLERRLPVRVVLTRDAEVNVPLDTRTAVANQNKADLFISLHFNSSFGARARGAETYFLSREASDRLAAEVAEKENNPGGEPVDDPELDLQLILWDLAQSYHLAESQRFANLVQEELNLALGLRDRGVKQAPFRVLMGATMPAVLVELGFLSNPEEEAKLQNPAYLQELVDALTRAVTRFKTQMEARDTPSSEGRR